MVQQKCSGALRRPQAVTVAPYQAACRSKPPPRRCSSGSARTVQFWGESPCPKPKSKYCRTDGHLAHLKKSSDSPHTPAPKTGHRDARNMLPSLTKTPHTQSGRQRGVPVASVVKSARASCRPGASATWLDGKAAGRARARCTWLVPGRGVAHVCGTACSVCASVRRCTSTPHDSSESSRNDITGESGVRHTVGAAHSLLSAGNHGS